MNSGCVSLKDDLAGQVRQRTQCQETQVPAMYAATDSTQGQGGSVLSVETACAISCSPHMTVLPGSHAFIEVGVTLAR